MMNQEEILHEAEKLLNEKKYNEAINLVTPEISGNHFLLLKSIIYFRSTSVFRFTQNK